jgi:hypothetical protein
MAQPMSDAAARAAYHESGHAIVAVAFGLMVGGAGIDPGHYSYCYVGPASLTDNLMVAFGGVEAEIRRFGTARANEARGDLEMIEHWQRRHRLPGHYVENMRPKVRRLLRRRWDQVERVASALALARRLSGAEIGFLVRTA